MTIIVGQKKPPLAQLAHHGIKGMRWGVRKEETSSTPITSISAPGVIARSDGSIDISKGANLQRLVRSNGKSLPMKDITYASINEYDNARYIKVIGGKGFLGGGRDQILSITATAPIKAPSIKDATKIHSDLMLHDAEYRKKNTGPLGNEISDKELERIRQNPTGKTAEAWYWSTNVKLTFDPEYDPDAPYIQSKLRSAVEKKGYNALRDENDVNSKVAKAPIIIFNPEKSLKVTKVTDITDELRKANKTKLKQYKSRGDEWINNELYSGERR